MAILSMVIVAQHEPSHCLHQNDHVNAPPVAKER
jgi:hypothetical protein